MSDQQDNSEHIQMIDGRAYYDNDKITYLLPCDIDECGRLEKQHQAFKYLFQTNYFVPLKEKLEEGIVVLDSGCGPGSWTIDMAREFPNSKFHGVDISNVFPEEAKVDNCEFVIGNLTERLPYEDNTFDYIHQRLLILGLTKDSWSTCYKELQRVLKPGGYIEFIEPCLTDVHNVGPLVEQLHEVVCSALEMRNIPFTIGKDIKDGLSEAGFVNIVEKPSSLPMNHGGKAGELIWGDYYHVYLNMRPMMIKCNPEWEELAAYELHLEKCGEEAKSNETSLPWYIVTAQKELD